jgi:hypothetical protein
MPSKDVIALIARQWAATSEDEKLHWKDRAMTENSVRKENEGLAEGVAELIDGDEGDKGKKKRAVKKPTPKVSAAV